MKRTYTFNKPTVILYFIPLLGMLGFLGLGIYRDPGVFVSFAFILTLTLLILIIWLSLLRRLSVDGQTAIWQTPRKRWEIPLSEVKHYGIVKFRSFRFIYLSRADAPPFEGEEAKVISTPDTFLIQFRKKAYFLLEDQLRAIHPDIQPKAYRKN